MASLTNSFNVFSDGSLEREQAIPPPVQSIGLLPLSEFTSWQRTILAANPNMYCFRKWGDPILGKYIEEIGVANFQAIGLYNTVNKTIGGVSNYLRVPRPDLYWLASILVEDDYLAKKEDWRLQKMNWLCQRKGTIYFYFHGFSEGSWTTLPYMEWGTIGLGGNMVQVEEVKVMEVKMTDGTKRSLPMGRLKGFRKTDMGKPLNTLLAEGLVHRCTCSYIPDDKYGDSPKGIVYSPFWSPKDYSFIGPGQPQTDNLWTPMEWLVRQV